MGVNGAVNDNHTDDDDDDTDIRGVPLGGTGTGCVPGVVVPTPTHPHQQRQPPLGGCESFRHYNERTAAAAQTVGGGVTAAADDDDDNLR